MAAAKTRLAWDALSLCARLCGLCVSVVNARSLLAFVAEFLADALAEGWGVFRVGECEVEGPHVLTFDVCSTVRSQRRTRAVSSLSRLAGCPKGP